MPRHQFGYINPVQISDFIHYQFYRIFPADCLMVNYPLNLQKFSAGGVDQALEAFWSAFDFLVDRKVERISQGGIPVSAYAGRPRILAMLEEARDARAFRRRRTSKSRSMPSGISESNV